MAAARSSKKSVQSVVLACEQCQCRNYTTPFNKKAHPQRFEIKKHCPRCNAHTIHRETK